jgi:hypothetical protein
VRHHLAHHKTAVDAGAAGARMITRRWCHLGTAILARVIDAGDHDRRYDPGGDELICRLRHAPMLARHVRPLGLEQVLAVVQD